MRAPFTLVVLIFTSGLGLLSAQTLDKFTVSGDAAKKTLTRSEISGETAAKIAEGCLDYARQHNVAVSVFVLSPTGQIVHAHRMDGQVPINTETAMLKAQSVLYTRTSTREYANRVNNNVALQLRWSKLPVFPVAGGLPIVVDNQLIGAIGVGGSNADEECAYAGIVAALGPQPPLPPNPAPSR